MMERALKERIIGAAVLVIVVVLIVPVFLDGPEENEVVSTNVPLPGQSNQDVRTVVLDLDRTDPVPAATNNDVKQAEPEPADVVVDDKPAVVVDAKQQQGHIKLTPPPAEEAKPASSEPGPPSTTIAKASSTTGMWAVQLGSFSDKKNAERLAAELRKQGFVAFLSELPTDSGELHRVRIGPQKDRAGADAMAERLSKAGHDGKVLPHP
jgi:DedD protein